MTRSSASAWCACTGDTPPVDATAKADEEEEDDDSAEADAESAWRKCASAAPNVARAASASTPASNCAREMIG